MTDPYAAFLARKLVTVQPTGFDPPLVVWRPVLGGTYEVSDAGEVRRAKSLRRMSRCDSGGYLKTTVCIDGRERTVLVHILVAEGFLGPRPEGCVVNHVDGVKSNNVPSNLEYVTPKGNSEHASRMGLAPSGDRHGRSTKPERTARGERVNTAKLTESEVVEARELRSTGWSLAKLCTRFGLSKSAMHSLCTGKNWKHVR